MKRTHLVVPLFLIATSSIAALPAPQSAPTSAASAPQADGPLKRPATADDLATAVLNSLRTSDAAVYYRLMPSQQEFASMCPGYKLQGRLEGAAALEEFQRRVRESLTACRSVGDWSTAKILRMKGGEAENRQEQGCPGLSKASDLKTYVEIGGKEHRIKLDSPFLSNGSYVLLNPPECE